MPKNRKHELAVLLASMGELLLAEKPQTFDITRKYDPPMPSPAIKKRGSPFGKKQRRQKRIRHGNP